MRSEVVTPRLRLNPDDTDSGPVSGEPAVRSGEHPSHPPLGWLAIRVESGATCGAIYLTSDGRTMVGVSDTTSCERRPSP